MRKATWTVLAAAAASTLISGVPVTAHADSTREDAAAARAVLALTTQAPDAAAASIPDGFAAAAGYRPTTVDGMLVNPNGDCSSPVPLPAEFDASCQAHDLGYDLLRYADGAGAQLGPWARRSLDAQLDRRMHDACAARTDETARASCFVMANVATTAVTSNSWRQGYVAPRPEPVTGYLLAAGGGLAVLGGAVAAGRLRRRGLAPRHLRADTPRHLGAATAVTA